MGTQACKAIVSQNVSVYARTGHKIFPKILRKFFILHNECFQLSSEGALHFH